jgi:hypothetical protein
VEKELMVRALEKFNRNQAHAAQYLDISPKTLIYRMEKIRAPKGTGGGRGPVLAENDGHLVGEVMPEPLDVE